MSIKKFKQCLDLHWNEVSSHVRDALVLMDDTSAECLHWHGGLKTLLDRGAVSAEKFSPFVKADLKTRKVVFVLSSPLHEETLRTLMIVIRSNSFRNCVVVSSLPARCHTVDTNKVDFFTFVENRMSGWMENMNYMSNVVHIPTVFASISSNVFVIPSMSTSFSISKCGLIEMNSKRSEHLTLNSLPSEAQAAFKNLSQSLISLFDTVQVRGEFFSLGSLSHILCSELESISQLQKKNLPNKVSVVVVDRLLDLAGPLSQSYETMLDKVLLALPHIAGHTFDVSVSMSSLSASKENSVFGRPVLAPGCLAHKNNSYEESALNVILSKKPREVLIETNRIIVDCAAKEGISLDLSSRLTPDVLQQRVLSFKQKPQLMSKYSGLLQQVLAVIQAIEYSTTNNIGNLTAIEKALLEYLATSGEEVLNNIMEMVTEKDEMNYKMEQILIFLAFFYMVSGNKDVENEPTMQATVMETFFQDENMEDLLKIFVEEEVGDDTIVHTVRTLFDVLRRLCTVRKKLKKYTSVFKSTNPAFPASYDPLLKQLLEDMFDATIADIPDLEFHSSGLKDYIKTGFSLFMNVTKPQPCANPTVYLIVLGGVTASEIKMVHEMAALQKETEIILGCTGILTPSEVLKDIGSIVKQLVAEIPGDDDF